MFLAREKYKTNIIEYILYMYHIEDIIRANHFDMEELEQHVLSKYKTPAGEMHELRAWYKNLISEMIRQDIQKTGHLNALKELIFKLNDLHIQLLNTLAEERYLELYHWASGYIKELKSKMKAPALTEIEVCIDGLYGFMLLKLKDQQVSTETSQAMAVFSQMLRYVSKKYHETMH